MSLHDMKFNDCLNYVERPVAILERKVMVLRNKEVPLVKVQWQHRRGSGWTWEPEAKIQEHYPELFSESMAADFEDEV